MNPWFAGAGTAALMTAGVVAYAQPVPEGMRIDLEDALPPRLAFSDTRYIPPPAPPPSAEARLLARLEAFARAVEEARGDAAPPPSGFDVAGLDAAIRKIVAPLQRKAAVSIHARDLASDSVLFDFQGDVPLNPASNHKLLTTAAAFDLLGRDYRFATRMLRAGDDLVIVGEGDPTLDHVALAAIADELTTKTDLTTLRRIVADDTAFSPRRLAPGFSDTEIGVSYQAPSGALSLNFNTVEITVARGEDGAPAVSVFPPSTHLVVDNKASWGRGSLTVRTYPRGEGDELHTVVEVAGKLRKNRSITERRRIVDPALYTAGALATMLAERTNSDPVPVVRGAAPGWGEDVELVTRRDSAPLPAVVADGLAWSNNFIAEQLLRTLAWRTTESPGDWDNGAAVVLGYWRALGLDPNALVFENGSGLSERGRVTTSALVDLIAVAHNVHAEDGGVLSALPVAGERGTMRARLRQSGKRVRAKTGTLDGVSGLTGVITAEDGTAQVGFSILINVDPEHFAAAKTRKRAEDRIVMTVLKHLDAWEATRAAAEIPQAEAGAALAPAL
jgi:D-alanyl-D-alanine carboxypeptidase/D-alanyl-D-alanine-endopeptidase (penicillin-binding protein 4)